MIIKRWNGSQFVKEFPQTKAQLITNASDTESIFDSFDKIRPAYLPNSVFDSLYYFSNGTPGATKVRAVDALKDALNVAYRSSLGYYWVVSTAGNLTSSGTATIETLYTKTCTLTTLSGILVTADTSELRIGMIVSGTNIPSNSAITAIDQNGTNFTINATPTANGSASLTFAYSIATFITSGEEREVGTTVTTVGLEIGDWFVISKVSGVGSIASPYNITFAVINNTYELMGGAGASTAGYSGLVPGASSGQNLHFLRGDGTWVIPTNTTYTGSTSITLNGTSFERAALTGDVTASANSNATTIADNAVTFAKFQNSVAAGLSVIGRSAASAGAFAEVAAGTDGDVLRRSGTTLGFGTIATAGITDAAVTFAKIQSSAATGLSVIGRSVNSAGVFAEVTAATDGHVLTRVSSTSLAFGQVQSGGIADDAVTYAKLQNISATNRILGRISAGVGNAEELTAANVRTIIELAAPIYIQNNTVVPTTTVTNALWYDIT
jgi:hypothetical protein